MAARLRLRLCVALWAASVVAIPTADAQVYKCTDGAGKTTYADSPCSASSTPLQLADPTKGAPTDPNTCAQLQDETRRLAAEADRNAQRGHKESSAGLARRHSLDQQYAARCMGISRAGPKPK